MKSLFVFMILLTAVLLSACKATISESAMQTAVSQVILTSSSEESAEESVAQPEMVAPSNLEELEEANAQLNDANLRLTDQAVEIERLQAELDRVYIFLTPTTTPTPQDTPTPTITSSPTPRPSETEFVLPWYHKYVEATVSAPLFYFKEENDAGFPLMLKTSPVKKISAGEEFIVNVNRVRADGGTYFYLIVGPKHEGLYVRIKDVENLK